MSIQTLPPQNLPAQNPVASLVATFWPDSYFHSPWTSGLCDDFGSSFDGAKTYGQYVQWLVSTATYGGDPVLHLPNDVNI